MELHPDPFKEFQRWHREARRAKAQALDAMVLATATPRGVPSTRIVLFKGIKAGGFFWVTNYESQKGRELLVNPKASLLFYWPETRKQLRIQGTVKKASRRDSNAYFQSRPRGSQIGAWASAQSAEIPSRGYLEARFAEFEKRFRRRKVPLPPFWGGFILVPERFEFWIERPNRLHERFRYLRKGRSWEIRRLSP